MRSIESMGSMACRLPGLRIDRSGSVGKSMLRVTAVLIVSIVMALAASPSRAQDSEQHFVTLERRSPQQMSADDAALLKARGGDVVRAAAFYGIDFEQGSWVYQQSVCPLLPQHLIVNYVRAESTGAETQFAAVVPRGNEPVRVVPVQRNGLAPFSPAETNANSVILFNRVWSSEGGDIRTVETQSNWVTLSLCYAEMVGSHPLIVTAKPLVERNAGPPTLRYESDGGASTLFADIGLPAQTWGWTLEFDRHGSLKQVQREKLSQPLSPQPLNPNTPASATLAQASASSTPEEIPSGPTAVAPQAAPSSSAATLTAVPQTTAETAPRNFPATQQTSINTAREHHYAGILPDGEAPPGRIISVLPDGQAPPGRIIPGPQELPPPAPK